MAEPSADLISLPKGGGALRAVGETFQPELYTGTGHYRVALELPPGRGALTPQLALTYSSGDGAGPFGMGWSLSLPQVRRRTDKRLPRYDDSDAFVLSGAEELARVPGATEPGVQRFRPRAETLFARIEHHSADGDYWVVISKDGLRSTYGTPRPATVPAGWLDPGVIADRRTTGHILSWLITSTVDTFGNVIAYEYAPDDADSTKAQRYLTQIGYADHGDPANPSFLVQVRLRYEPRPDASVDRRGGFPVVTGQRCATIETWMDTGEPVLARTVALTYSDAASRVGDNGVSLLSRITVTGHDGAATQDLPPLEFGYSTWDPADRRYQAVGDPATGSSPAQSLADPTLDVVDLFGTGLPDVLRLDAAGGRYWRNRGAGRLDRPRTLTRAPSGFVLGAAGVQLLDADGDGRPDLFVTDGRRAGYFPIGRDGAFDPAGYVAYSQAPPFSPTDPDTRLIDLDGDGVVDALHIGSSVEAYLNDRKGGWQALPADHGSPLLAVSFADPGVKLADMTGDGLTDIVLVGNGRVQYWPNLGYGRFGAPVVMAASPRFDDAALYGPTGFDPARLLLGDVDGDGAADVVYVGMHGTTVWINRAGTGFAAPVVVPATPQPDSATAVRLADMLGTGVAGVLWSYDAGRVRGGNYKFLDLTGGAKPYLLTRIDNHAGAVTEITYAPSTRYAEADAAAGTPWRTTLPFPVHVVASTQVRDHFSATTQTSEYDYHHGYWDGAEREFRGFGRVHHRDTLTTASPIAASVDDSAMTPSPPTETRSWFHLGPVGPEFGAWTDLDLTGEYWPEDRPLAPHLDTSALPAELPRRVLRDAIRAARGTLLREELYALDDTPLRNRPYEVTDHAVALAPVLDGRDGNEATSPWLSAPVVTARPTLTRHTIWERGTDPMHRIKVTGHYDDYGRPADVVDLAVPRGHDPAHADPAGAVAEPYIATQTHTVYATRDDSGGYLTDRVACVRRSELSATSAAAALDVAAAALAGTAAVAGLRSLTFTFYDGPPGAGPAIPAGQLGGLGFGRLGDHGLPTRVEQLAITPAQLAAASLPAAPPSYLPSDGNPAAVLPAEYPAAFAVTLAPLAGYTWHAEGTDPVTGAPYAAGYYTQTARHAYDVQSGSGGRGLPVAHRDPLGHDTVIAYDAFQLLPVTVTDPLGLVHGATYDYRVLHPAVITDPNGNLTRAGYTPLGLPAWIAIGGKPGENRGDTPEQPGVTYDYRLTAWDDSAAAPARQPASVHTSRRVEHRWAIVDAADAARRAAGQAPLIEAEIAALFPADEASLHPERFVQLREHSDGFGRALQTRHQSDPVLLDDLGVTADQTVPPCPATAHSADPAGPAPVAVSGWKRYDDKGRVITAWESFCSTGYDYQRPDPVLLSGLAAVDTYYDPRGLALVVTEADGSQTLTVPGVPLDVTDPTAYAPTPWVSFRYDRDDNAGRTHAGTSGSYSAQYNTPASITVDALGRTIEEVHRVAASDAGATVNRTAYDIDGNVVSLTDALGRTAVSTVHDCLKRPWRRESIDSGTTRSVRDPAGNILETRDDKGALTLAGHDAGYRPTRTWCRDTANQPVTLREATVFGDAPEAGLPPDAAAAANLLGRPYRTYDDAGLVTTPAYDLDGNQLSRVRRILRPDLLLSALPTGAGTWDGTAYAVDWQPSAGQTLDQGAAALLDPTEYQTDAAFDALRRATSRTGPLDVTGGRTALACSYTPSGKLTRLSVDGTPYLSQVVYNARDQRVLAVLGDNILIRYVYDPQTFRLVRLRSEPANASAPLVWNGVGNAKTALQDCGFAYDLVGNVLALTDRTPGSGLPVGVDAAHSPDPDALDRAFGYDPLYRLTTATGRETALAPAPPWSDSPAGVDVSKARPYTETYTYDLAGNVLALGHTSTSGYTRTFGLSAGSNRLTSLGIAGNGSFAYSSDACGNLTVEGYVRRYEWDHANRLTTFRTQTTGAVPSVYAQYRYNTAGERVVKVVRRQSAPADVTIFLDGLFERLIVAVGDSATSTHDTVHVVDAASRVAVVRRGAPVPGDPYPGTMYHLTDHLGSNTAVLDSGGTLLNREEYLPHGETSLGSYLHKRYRYSGRERDEESGLSQYRFRYYAPWLCRWTAPDPAAHADGLNLFAFVRGNPLRYVDPTGTQTADAQPVDATPGDADQRPRAQAPRGEPPAPLITQAGPSTPKPPSGTPPTTSGSSSSPADRAGTGGPPATSAWSRLPEYSRTPISERGYNAMTSVQQTAYQRFTKALQRSGHLREFKNLHYVDPKGRSMSGTTHPHISMEDSLGNDRGQYIPDGPGSIMGALHTGASFRQWVRPGTPGLHLEVLPDKVNIHIDLASPVHGPDRNGFSTLDLPGGIAHLLQDLIGLPASPPDESEPWFSTDPRHRPLD